MLTANFRPQLGSLQLVTAATSDPVTVDEMLAHARLDTVPEGNSLLEAYISAATAAVIQHTGRELITETWRLILDDWPGGSDEWWDGMRLGALSQLSGGAIEIRKAPFISASAVATVNEDATTTAFSSDYWYSTVESGYGKLSLRSGQVWPVLVPPIRAVGGIRVTFTAGYGTNASDVPAPIRHAIKMTAAHFYENREAQEIPAGAAALLAKYKVLR